MPDTAVKTINAITSPPPPLFKRLLARAVIYPFLLLGVLAAVLVWQVLHLLTVISGVEHSDEIISKATLSEKLIIDRETGLRGYLITGDLDFLQPYETASGLLSENVRELRGLFAGDADQTARVESIQSDIVAWQKYAEDLKGLVASGGDARGLVVSRRGKVLMDQVRATMRELIERETTMRDAQSHSARTAAAVVLATSGGATLLIGAIITVMIRRQLGDATEVYRRALGVEEQRNQEKAQLLARERAARSEAEHASRMKDEFLATLSHELRTPLSAIVGWSQLLQRVDGNKDDLRHGLETIARNARVQTQLIDDLLDMSRIVSGKLRLEVQRLDPVTFIEAAIETVSPAAEAKSIRIERVLDPHAGPISGDPNRLQQVIWNLLSNAVKFTAKGGRVQVLLERVNSHLEISVADTGQGIKAELLPHLFERFRQGDSTTTRRHGGLGLGLAIVKQLVELHGGTVRAKSRGDGQGATFVVHLPLTVLQTETDSGLRLHPRTSLPQPFAHGTADLSGLKVLVVDDESDARELIRRVLEECKASVVTAGSAAEALKMLESETPSVLVSDIGMPEMDGYEFLTKVRVAGDGVKIPAIALTAFARSEDRTKALMTGYLAHLSKPVEPSELVATVASVTGRTGSK